MVIFIVVIVGMMINTGAIPGSGHKGGTNQGGICGSFLSIEAEKTEIFETEPLNVTVSINDVFVNNFRPLFSRFYVYIIYEPSNPQNFIVDGLYRRVVGHSKLLSYSELKEGIKVENCSFTTLQTFEKGHIRAKVVPLWLSKMPRIMRFYLNFCNCPRWGSNTENITVYNILDEMKNIGVKTYEFTYTYDTTKEKWDKWQSREEKKKEEQNKNNTHTLEKGKGDIWTYDIEANSRFIVAVTLYNNLNIDIDNAWVQVALIKPSKFGVGVGEDTVVIASGGLKINKNTSKEEKFTGYIPLNIENGQYRTKATVYIPYTGWIPTPNSHYGDYLYVHGGIESSLISNSQLENMKLTLFMLIPILFGLGLVFAASKKYIYYKMDEKLEKRRESK